MMTDGTITPRIHVLAKPTGSTCNLNCACCFYLKKEIFYPDSRFRMSDEVLENYISKLIESHCTDTVTVAWQGGDERGGNFFEKLWWYDKVVFDASRHRGKSDDGTI